jgi:hypothetical protein
MHPPVGIVQKHIIGGFLQRQCTSYGPLSYHHKPAQTRIFPTKGEGEAVYEGASAREMEHEEALERPLGRERIHGRDLRIFHWEGKRTGRRLGFEFGSSYASSVIVSFYMVFLDSALIDPAIPFE